MFFFQAEGGIGDLVRSRGLGDGYKRQAYHGADMSKPAEIEDMIAFATKTFGSLDILVNNACLLYTSDAADERSSVDLGGRRIIKKKKQCRPRQGRTIYN